MTDFTYSYIITNRQDPTATKEDDIKPLPSGELWFYTAKNDGQPYNTDYSAYSSLTTLPLGATEPPPRKFVDRFVPDENMTLPNQWNSPMVTLYIHGLGNSFKDAVEATAAFGLALQTGSGTSKIPDGMPANGTYQGLVIGFDWPSFSLLDSPSRSEYEKTRQNIQNSIGSFNAVFDMLLTLGAVVNVVCHSEGNYMDMVGMQKRSTSAIFQTVLLAADINNGAFSPTSLTNGGWGANIAAQSEAVSVYYSTHDPLLTYSKDYFKAQHNPNYPGRLGLSGPDFSQTQNANMFAVDCSAVVEEFHLDHLKLDGYVPALTNLHSSYRYIPQVLWDISQVLNGVAPGSVFDRNTVNANQYTMFATDLT